MEVRLVDRPVAEEGDRHGPVLPELRGERRAGRSGDGAADDAEAADHAVVEVDHVHRAATTSVRPRLAAEELAEQGGLVDPHRQAGAVAAIRGGDRVPLLEQVADADRDRLLPLVEVRGSLHLVVQEEPVHRVLELADAHHPLVEAREVGRRRLPDVLFCIERHDFPLRVVIA